jgi:hypothetical protein
MILQLDGASSDDIQAGKNELATLAASWGHELTDDLALRESSGTGDREERVIDPVSLTALVVSIPSAALAVLDLADRIRKRRRAKGLIDHTRQLAARHVSVYVMGQHAPIEISALDPDQLLDLLADKPPTN